jgi:diacylglycerol O-acyltransferase / trehalose O-mycolyltransferase
MRRMWAASAAMLVCLALGTPVMAQEASPSTEGSVLVTATQACAWSMTAGVQTGTCTYSASDPRVTGPLTLTMAEHVGVPGGDDYVQTFDATLPGPEGTWTGRYWVIFDQATETAWVTSALSGDGAYEGWTYVASGSDASMAGNQDLVGALYEGPPPPGITVGPLPPPASEPSVPPTPEPSLATIGLPADDGARIVAVGEIDARTRDLTIASPSVGTVMVRLLLPSAFDAQSETRWPVLYLLQGCCDTYDSWTRETDVEELTAPTDLLVVMPAATRAGDGGFGWYTDWYNDGEGGQPAWETFHLTELRQLLERNWQAGDDRVIAGLSMGGHGAMTYAARHPDMFKAAASFSGVLHALEFDADPRVWGGKTEQADIWAAHDAVSLAPALEGLPLFVSYGTGEYGPLDQVEDQESADVEAWLYPQNEAFVARLGELAIPATVDVGPGTHSWPYWERGLHEAMPMLLEAVGL